MCKQNWVLKQKALQSFDARLFFYDTLLASSSTITVLVIKTELSVLCRKVNVS